MPPGDLPRQAHGAHGGGQGADRPVRVGGQKGGAQGGQLTARPRHPAHLRAAIVDDKAALPVAHQVRLPGDGHQTAQLPGGPLHKDDLLRKTARLLAVGVHPTMGVGPGQQGPQFRDVAAQGRDGQAGQQHPGGVGAHGAGSRPHRVQQDRSVQTTGLLSCRQHGRHPAAAEGAQIQHQASGQGGDIGALLRVVGHDGAGPAGQQDIGHVVGRDIVGNGVDHRGLLPDPGQIVAQIQVCSLQKKKPRRV